MIDSGEVKNQAELAREKGISRTRVTQISNILKLSIVSENVTLKVVNSSVKMSPLWLKTETKTPVSFL